MVSGHEDYEMTEAEPVAFSSTQFSLPVFAGCESVPVAVKPLVAAPAAVPSTGAAASMSYAAVLVVIRPVPLLL